MNASSPMQSTSSSYSCMQVRERELHLIGKTAVVKTLNLCLVFAVPPVIALVIFATYAYQVGPLTPAMAFVVLSLFNTLRFPLVVLPKALRGASGRYTVSVPFSCTALCSRQRWQGMKACYWSACPMCFQMHVLACLQSCCCACHAHRGHCCDGQNTEVPVTSRGRGAASSWKDTSSHRELSSAHSLLLSCPRLLLMDGCLLSPAACCHNPQWQQQR